MYHKEGKINEQQKQRRLLLLKYSWEAKSISQLCTMVNLHRGTVYRLFDDDPKLKSIVEARIAGKHSELTAEELLEGASDEQLSHIPTLREIALEVLEPFRGRSALVAGMDVPMIKQLPTKYKVVAIDPVATITTQDNEAKLRKAESICELIAQGSTTNQACDVMGIKATTFVQWVNPSSKTYSKEVSDMYTAAKTAFNVLLEEETLMLAKQSLKQLVEGRQVKIQTKMGRVDKEGKIKTTMIKETDKFIEPHFAAVAKMLATREANKYGTPEERKQILDGQEMDYELRSKSLEELEAEEKALMEKLYGKSE